MHIISIILFALTSNIDNFTIGIAYGMKKIKVGIFSNLIVAFISAIGTFISMSIGLLISNLLPVRFSNILGAGILVVIGLWFIKDFFTQKKLAISKDNKLTNLLDNPYGADTNNSGNIDIKESITLAFALTINNLGLGIGASITGLNIQYTTTFTFIFSILTLSLGSLLGNSFLSWLFGRFAPLVSGLIIVVLGIYEMLI
ncbi:sporulation membrane protein YtaF [Clostridium paridis]|uniref:Sporulation membrane protein YtaF n=1 Tax=Clostridium paridis TaxID=2803863 RepID=A0A937FF80_9CLOT|nr:sporulation membrane protein YtaF [Clostridium paridis]MBL4932254.1 sporulation membrane protein YtaF [Clostridium paridis]